MKLIYIANARIPTEKAHGIQIMQMCESFALCDANIRTHSNDTNKIEVELVVPWRFNSIKQDSFEYYGIERSFKITKIPSLDLVKFGKIGFLIQSLSFAKLAALFTLFKKADIIYSRDELPLFYLNFFGKRNLFWESHTAKKNFIVKRIFKKCKGIITITQGLKDFYVKEYGIDSNKILGVPDGVDINEFDINISKEEAREKLNLPQDKKIVMYTGHLYDWKGAGVLLETAKQFPISNFQFSKDILFVFVGGTDNDIKNYELRFKNYENIRFEGRKPHGEIPIWLKAADVLVLPNTAKEKISKYYTSPLKLFEYMAAQKPIVAS
ncbi:hypothetical protein COT96_00125, partial [Candidatus Falkowbacteria bacterium CG10_big_fil_rev_8_21_14_0_10_38_22]